MKKFMLILFLGIGTLLLTGCGNKTKVIETEQVTGEITKEKVLAPQLGLAALEIKDIETGVVVDKTFNVIIPDNAGVETPKFLDITAHFTQEFIDKYKYEDSEGYNFAIQIDGDYYNAFRNHNDGVSNSRKDGLDGAIAAVNFKEGYTRHIPLGEQIVVSQPVGTYGYKYTTIPADDTINHVIRISSVKEGVPTHYITAQYIY